MERVTMSLDDVLLADFDRYVAARRYRNRSEAIRDLLRERLERERAAIDAGGDSVGCLSYVYNHHHHRLAQRLSEAQHGRHDLILSTLRLQLDHDNCFEVALLRGPTAELRDWAKALLAETGIRHGRLSLTAVEIEEARHSHRRGKRARGHVPPHLHLRPRS